MASVAHWPTDTQGGIARPLQGPFLALSRFPDGNAVRPLAPVSGAPRAVPAGAATGLVSLATKRTETGLSPKIPQEFSISEFRDFSRKRRLCRTRAAVLAKSRSIRSRPPVGFRWTGAFITLTYRGVRDWRSQHVSAFFQRLRAFGRRRGIRFQYVWVAETQRRGALHFHIVVWWSTAEGRDFRLPKPDSCGWWPHGFSNIRRLRSAGEAYLAKYVSKGDDGALPKGLRIYGMDRDPADSLCVHRACLPRWLAEACPSGRVKRVPGFGWQSVETGARYWSPWKLTFHRDGDARYWKFSVPVDHPAACVDCRIAVVGSLLACPQDMHSPSNPCGFEFCVVCSE